MHTTFLKGLIIGFVIAVPVGPTGLLCINRGLSGGAGYGLLSWLGVATGDALTGSIAALGLTLVSPFFFDQYARLHVLAGLLFCFFGFRVLISQRVKPALIVRERKLLEGFTSTFLLTVTNPITFASFFAIYVGWGVKILRGEYFSAALLAVAIFIGTALWWLILGATLSFCRKRFTDSVIRGVDLLSGAVIVGFGFILLIWA